VSQVQMMFGTMGFFFAVFLVGLYYKKLHREVLNTRKEWNEDQRVRQEMYEKAVVSLTQERDSLRMKVIRAEELLDRWADLFNWREWRTDTKHTPDETVSDVLDKTTSREWDQEIDGYRVTKVDYLIEAGKLRFET
jgi:hypothetical protein